VTLRDAVKYMTSLPRKEQNAEHWRPAVTLLAIIGEKGGCRLLAELAVVHGLRKGVKLEPEFDYSRKSPSFSKHQTETGCMTEPGTNFPCFA
jgi:hypothetical protein